MFAEGAATGWLHRFRNSVVTGCEGHRMPTVCSPAVTRGETALFFFSISVRGPGKKYRMNVSAVSGISDATSCICSEEWTWIINGLSDGLPFAAKIFSMDVSLEMSPPSP